MKPLKSAFLISVVLGLLYGCSKTPKYVVHHVAGTYQVSGYSFCTQALTDSVTGNIHFVIDTSAITDTLSVSANGNSAINITTSNPGIQIYLWNPGGLGYDETASNSDTYIFFVQEPYDGTSYKMSFSAHSPYTVQANFYTGFNPAEGCSYVLNGTKI